MWSPCLASTLVIGILVDDAIVEVENIEKRVYVGLRPFRAAIEGADQIGLAVVATTFSIVAVFVPVAFMPGIPGQFFREFGITVSVAVLFSPWWRRWSATLLLAAYLRRRRRPPRSAGRCRRSTPAFWTWVIDHRIIAVFIGAVVFVGSVLLFLPLKKGVQPESNPNYYSVNIEAPPARPWRTCAGP